MAHQHTTGGFFAYVMTPFDAKGAVDTGVLEAYVTALVDQGVPGLTCVASTTEGPYLTEPERQRVVEVVCQAAAGKAHVNVGVGGVATAQVLEKVQHAEDCGASRLMLDMQTYFPIPFEGAYRHFETIAASTSLPIRLYNIVEPTHFDFTPERVARMAPIERIDSIKESSGDPTRVRDIRSLCGERFAVLCGFHYMVREASEYGAAGWECGLHPLITKPCLELYHDLMGGGEFQRGVQLYDRLLPLFYFFRYYGVPQSIKAMSQWSDIPLGDPRSPLPSLDHQAKQRLQTILKELELL